MGAWGDSICAYGEICKLLKGSGEEKANVVFFGLDQNICEFFKAQPNIACVEWLKIEPPSLAPKYVRLAVTDPAQWYDVTGLKDQIPDLIYTHIQETPRHATPDACYRDFDCALPPCLGNWESFLAPKKPYLLFQPYSTQSCGYEDHWPHWQEALKYLVDHADQDIVVVGETPSDVAAVFDLDLLDHPRVTCLLGQTRSMVDVLHIASWADRMVTTCNALAYWSQLRNIPAVVAANRLIRPATPYYYHWLKHARNGMLEHDDDFDRFRSSFGSLKRSA